MHSGVDSQTGSGQSPRKLLVVAALGERDWGPRVRISLVFYPLSLQLFEIVTVLAGRVDDSPHKLIE